MGFTLNYDTEKKRIAKTVKEITDLTRKSR